MGNIPKNKKQISITLEKKTIERLRKDAEEDVRNVSSLIGYIIKLYYDNKDLNE